MTTTQRSKRRAFPRFTASSPECPTHGPMRLVPMARPSWTLTHIMESRSRSVWRCTNEGCARVEFEPARDGQPFRVSATVSKEDRRNYQHSRFTLTD
jgi:hypothetical protein